MFATTVGSTLVLSRSNGGPVEWLMSEHWKKELSSIFHPLILHTIPPISLPLSLFSSFLPLLFLVPCPTFAQGRIAAGEQQSAKWRDRQIYRGISFAGRAWQILNSLNHSSSLNHSFSLFPSLSTTVSTTDVHP